MEAPSGRLCTGRVPWQGVLLTVSLVTSWSSVTTAQVRITQVRIEPVPPHVAEGKSVLLRVSSLPKNVQFIFWYKGKPTSSDSELARYVISTNISKTGPAHSGRETIFPNGSLLIQNVNQKDSGIYTLQIQNVDGDRKDTSVQFYVRSEPTTSGLAAGDIAGIVIGVLLGVALVAALGYMLLFTRIGRPSLKHDLREPQFPESTPGRGLSDSFAMGPNFRASVPIYEDLVKPDLNIYDRINPTAVAAS